MDAQSGTRKWSSECVSHDFAMKDFMDGSAYTITRVLVPQGLRRAAKEGGSSANQR